MELRRLFPANSCPRSSRLTATDGRVNGNTKLPLVDVAALNNVGSDNCGSVPSIQNNVRMSRGFYARLPPLGRSGAASATSVPQETGRQQKEPSEAKLNALFDQYKVNLSFSCEYSLYLTILSYT